MVFTVIYTGFLEKKVSPFIEFLVKFLLIIQLKAMLFFQKPCINSGIRNIVVNHPCIMGAV